MRRLCFTMLLFFALAPLAFPVASQAQIISITIAPPEIPVYEQPPIPAAGYMCRPVIGPMIRTTDTFGFRGAAEGPAGLPRHQHG